MCIYCGTNRYRKIYEKHHGPIPKDESSRSYEIHHIDGNRLNNDPLNLKCVSIKEHYDIHFSQEDWGACRMIGRKMNLSTEEISNLSRKIQQNRVANGTHPFIGLQEKLVKNGEHHFLGGAIQRKMVQDGIHPWTNKEKASEKSRKRVMDGTHNFLGGEQARKNNQRMLTNGTHPSQVILTCEHCNKAISSSMHARWHGNNCKSLRK